MGGITRDVAAAAQIRPNLRRCSDRGDIPHRLQRFLGVAPLIVLVLAPGGLMKQLGTGAFIAQLLQTAFSAFALSALMFAIDTPTEPWPNRTTTICSSRMAKVARRRREQRTEG